MATFDQNLAKLAIKYAVKVKPKDQVFIMGSEVSADLIRELYREIARIGGFPFAYVRLSGLDNILFRYGNIEQLQYVPPALFTTIQKTDVMIQIHDEINTKHLEQVDPEKIGIADSSPQQFELMKIFMERTQKGEARWTIVPYPCQALAQEAGMDIYSYTEFVEKALKLDLPDPIKAWETLNANQVHFVEYLNKIERIHVVGEDTDLALNVKGRTWINCSGTNNLPDGEVFTGPIESSANGHIRFTFPGIYEGKEIENIYLEFKDGKVVHATASKGQELLDVILKIENANQVGEFAIGTNYGIQKFTKNMLFDEKMGGTLHMALGRSLPESGGMNESAIHWDILKDMKSPGSKIFADNKVIYEAGQWKI